MEKTNCRLPFRQLRVLNMAEGLDRLFLPGAGGVSNYNIS